MTINQVIEQIKKTSARQVIENTIKKAESISDYGAILSLTTDRALARADEVDNGKIGGVLAGVPFIVKDNYLTFGGPTTAASKMLEKFYAPLQASAVEKLESQGAICIGKSNLDAFAHGGSTENSYFGSTKNAHDKSRVAGGSSGGSAVVTALDIVPFALGSDTGGSIRQPASYNGVVGYKPTYGMVSRYGVVAMASSTDTMGAFTNNVADAELVIGIMAGQDEKDMTTLPDYFKALPDLNRKMRIGVISECLTENVSSDVKQVVDRSIDKLKKAGHKVDMVSLPMMKYALAIYYIIIPAEICSNLARYDGIRYTHQSKKAKNLKEIYGYSRDEGFMIENKRRIMIGSFVLSSGFYDAYYLKAQKARTLLIEQFDKLFKQYDILLSPVAPTTAFRFGQNTKDPIKMYLEDIMTVPASLAGLPAISLPAGCGEHNLPIGIQLIGDKQADAKVLALAKSMETK